MFTTYFQQKERKKRCRRRQRRKEIKEVLSMSLCFKTLPSNSVHNSSRYLVACSDHQKMPEQNCKTGYDYSFQ
jgi:hypothetical protein